jgi:hypothetical protein
MRWSRARALPALVVWWAAGCEAMVTGQLGDVHCQAEGQVGPPACPDGYACRTGLCVPSLLGAPCVVDGDCAAGDLCLDPGTLGAPGAARCSRPCCTSSDCDPDGNAVCWLPPAGGGAFCRTAVDVGRVPGGTLEPLAQCTSGGDCRSGLCTNHRCADTCCSDTSCAGAGGACSFDGPPSVEAMGFWCSAPTGGLGRYALCTSDADCATGLCVDFGNKLPQCTSTCCSSAECETYDDKAVRCVLLTGAHAGVRACMPEPGMPPGQGAVGTACKVDSDCRGGMCLGSLCSDLCCTDASCGDPAQSVCRLGIVGGVLALRCEPK